MELFYGEREDNGDMDWKLPADNESSEQTINANATNSTMLFRVVNESEY